VAQRVTDSCTRAAEVATVGQHVERGGRQLMCGPAATVSGGGKI
jgi:hypothetical protein